jgi:hypothetical protein
LRPAPAQQVHAIECFAAARNGLTPGSARSAETLSRMTIRMPDVASSPGHRRFVSRLCAGHEGHAIICRDAGESRYNQTAR